MSDWVMICTLTGSLIGMISILICIISISIKNSSSSFTRATMMETVKCCEVSAIAFIVIAAVFNLLDIFRIFSNGEEFLVKLAERWIIMTNVFFQIYFIDILRRRTIKNDQVLVSFFPDMPYSEILKLKDVYPIGLSYLFISAMLIFGGNIWVIYTPSLKTADLLRTLSSCVMNYTAGCMLLWIVVRDDAMAKYGWSKFIHLLLAFLGMTMLILRCSI